MNFSGPTDQALGARLWYRRLVACYPAAFREHHGEEMIRMFDEDWSHACAQGVADRRRYAMHVAWDALRTLPKELYSAAPRLWTGFLVAAATLKFLSFWDPRIGCCVLIFCSFYWVMLRFVLRLSTGLKLLLASLWAPIGYGWARFMGYAGVWAMGSYGHLNRQVVFGFALGLFLYANHLLRRKKQSKAFVGGGNGVAILLGLSAMAVGMGFGRAGWQNNLVWFSCAYVHLVILGGLKLYFKVWRGVLISDIEGVPFLAPKP